MGLGIGEHESTSWGDRNALYAGLGGGHILRSHLRLVPVVICVSDLSKGLFAKRKGSCRWRWERGLFYLPSWMRAPVCGHPGAEPCACPSPQSEEDISVTALGKQQPENISNPLYDSMTSAPPEPSYDPFSVSVHFYQPGCRGMRSFSKSRWKASHQEKLTSRTCLGATSVKASVAS